MNLSKSIRTPGTQTPPLRRTRQKTDSSQASRPNIGEIALMAGAAAFLITTTLLTAAKTIRQQREMRRYLNGETTDGLANAAESILQLIESGSQQSDGERYPASFPLELEREQHRMVEAYARLYRLLGAKERSELPEPGQLLIFRGIAAYETRPASAVLSAAADGRSPADGSRTEYGAEAGLRDTATRFVPDAYQLESLNLLYMLCLDIQSLVSEEHEAAYRADRSERSVARLLTAIGQRLG